MTDLVLTDDLLRAALVPVPSIDRSEVAGIVSDRIRASAQRRRGLSLPWRPSPAATLQQHRQARLLQLLIAAALVAAAVGIVAAGSNLLPPPAAPPQWLLFSEGQALSVPDGGGERRPLVALGHLRFADVSVSWNGEQLATIRGPRNAILEVWDADAVLADRATNPVRFDLPDGLLARDAGVWRHDGGSLLLTVGIRGATRIYVLDLTTGDLQQITPDGVHVEDWQPAPNDRWVEFIGVQAGRHALYLVDLDSREIATVFEGDGGDIPVAGALGWSPDSARMTVAIEHEVIDAGIWSIRPDGTDLRRITPAGQNASWMNWSPDGQWITYQVQSTIGECSSLEDDMYETWVIRPDGTGPRLVAPMAWPIGWADDSRSVVVESQVPLPGAPLGGVIKAFVDGSPPQLVYPYTAADTSGHRCHLYGVFTKKYGGNWSQR